MLKILTNCLILEVVLFLFVEECSGIFYPNILLGFYINNTICAFKIIFRHQIQAGFGIVNSFTLVLRQNFVNLMLKP